MILQWFLHIQRIFCIISNLVWVGKVEMDKRVASKVNKYRSIIHFVIFTNYTVQWKPRSLMKEYSITPSEKVMFASPFETSLLHTNFCIQQHGRDTHPAIIIPCFEDETSNKRFHLQISLVLYCLTSTSVIRPWVLGTFLNDNKTHHLGENTKMANDVYVVEKMQSAKDKIVAAYLGNKLKFPGKTNIYLMEENDHHYHQYQIIIISKPNIHV